MNITIINTGGTFNKQYNPINGELEVRKDNFSLKNILKNCPNINFDIKNPLSKDSLFIDDNDRKIIANTIKNSKNSKIIIIHGTDTLHLTSKFLATRIYDKKIVLTGAMVPMSIEVSEATMNFAQALGFLNASIENGVYISMHGVVISYEKIRKNREIGKFIIC